jgi:hypothetical protein
MKSTPRMTRTSGIAINSLCFNIFNVSPLRSAVREKVGPGRLQVVVLFG